MASFFVSYTGDDRDWAEWIAWELEAAGHAAIIQAWDFRPGNNFVLEMDEATKADHTIAVLSPSYMKAVYTKPEWAAAFAQDASGRRRKLIPVRVRSTELTGLLTQIVYIDLVGKDEVKARGELLSGVTEGRAKPQRVPFPGLTVEPAFPGPAGQTRGIEGGDAREVLNRARKLITKASASSTPTLRVAVEPSSPVSLLRPSEFDAQSLSDELLRVALFEVRLLSAEVGSPIIRERGTINISQRDASFHLNEQGEIVVSQTVIRPRNLAIIEEDVLLRLERALQFAARALAVLKGQKNVGLLGIACRMDGANHVGWQTEAEHVASPNRVSMLWFGPMSVSVDLGRLVSHEDVDKAREVIAKDLLVLLRREVRG